MEAAALSRRARAVEELRRLSTVADQSDVEAAALARRARALEELRRLSTAAESDDDTPAALARRTRAVEQLRRVSTVSESDDTLAEQECDHFSLRSYVSLLQKKDPTLCSPHIFCNQPQHDEFHDSPPILVSMYHRWDCSKCLDRVKVSDHRPTSENVSMQQDAMNDGCTISIVRILPLHSRRLFSCTQQSSEGNDRLTHSKTAQECNSKCSSLGNKAITAMNVIVAEENVPEAFVERSVPATKDLQASPNNIDVSANTLNAVSNGVSNLPDDAQVISVLEENGIQNPCSPRPCVAPNEDENNIAQDVPNDDPNESNVCKSVSGHKGKQVSGHKSNQVCNKGPRRASLKRNVGSDGKKKRNKSTELPDISDHKFCQRKRKKTRLLSELIGTEQVGVSADAVRVDQANSIDICEGGKRKMHLEVGNDNDTPNQKLDEIQPRAVKNKAKHTGVDKVDDGSSLMNWLKSTHKKVRTEKKDSEHKNIDSSAVSNSVGDIHHDCLPSVGDVAQEKVPSTTSAKHGNGNVQIDNLEQNLQKVGDPCQNESRNLKQKFFSNEKSTILLKRKVPSTSVAHDENIVNSTIKRDMLRSDDLPQMEPEGSVQRCLTKVSLDKQKIQNVPGLRKKNIPKSKKKGKQEVHEKQNVIDDFPMDIVELLARNQHERQLMTHTNSLERCHTQPMVSQVDCAEFAAKDCPINPSNEFDTNFQISLASERKQKSIQDHASCSTEAVNVNLQDLHTQKSPQCHAASSTSTEVPNGHPPESQIQSSFQIHALPITGSFNVYPPKLPVLDIVECTQEQQTQFHRDEEVTIACTSPIFSHHQQIAEVPARSWRNNGEKKLMWDSFKTASMNSPTSSYGFQYGNRLQEVDSAPIHAFGASSNYAAHQPVIVAVDHYTKEAVSQVQPSVPSTALTMEAGRLYDQRIPGQSGLYPKDTMPATHLLRLMDSSTAPGFTNYQRANRRQMELQTQTLGLQYMQHDQYNASPSTSYGSHIIEKVPLTLQDLSLRQVQQNLHMPLRPHPRVGVLGSLLQQDIANWSENCGPQSGYRLGVSKGTASLDMNRKGNYETSNSGMFSAGWNALQLGSVSSVAHPEYQLPRYGTGQPSTSGNGKTVHPLDKLVRKDICVTNRNPADFTVISEKNEYMRSL